MMRCGAWYVMRGAWVLVVLFLAGCGQGEVEVTGTAVGTATIGVTATVATPQVVMTRVVPAGSPIPPTLQPTVERQQPTPTSAPLNEPVALVPKGGASCEDYPCFDQEAEWVERIQVPDGFVVRYVALLEGMPTSMVFGSDGLLYVAMQEGAIVTVDEQGQVSPFVEGLLWPVGLAFRPGTSDLYVSHRLDDSTAQVSAIIGDEIRPIITDVPCCYASLHAANGLAFGADGFGYLSVGARADHGEVLDTDVQDELHPWEATILRFSPDGSEIEPYAFGLRNAFDIAFDGSGRLFAADNAPDFGPPDEFHLVEPGGQHGYPWYVCDHCFSAPAGTLLIPPTHELIPHGAPTGMTAYLAEQFPGYYNNIFLTLWSAFPGAQKIVRFGPGGEEMTDFATGFAAPIDVAVSPAGGLYVVDWATGIIFEISYQTK